MSNIKWKECNKIKSLNHKEILIRKNYYDDSEVHRATLYEDADGSIGMVYTQLIGLEIGVGYKGSKGRYALIPSVVVIDADQMDCYEYTKDSEV